MRRQRPARGVTARAIVIGLLITPLNVFFLVRTLFAWGWFTGDYSLFDNAVAILVLLVALNQLVKWRRPGWAFGPGEMLTIYIMVVMTSALTSSIFTVGGALATDITYPFWFATAENEWETLVHPYLPGWLTVTDRTALESFFRGESSPYVWANVRQWLLPAFWWTAFLSALAWVCLCLNSIVRRRWADEEKLAFPMTVLPVHLVEQRMGLFRSKLWWIGIGLSAGLALWNTLAGVLPNFPVVRTSFAYLSYLGGGHPWDLIRYPTFNWIPSVIGLCYLMPLDLAFSLFVFDLFWMAEYVLAGRLGWCTSSYSGFPYGDQQVAGGVIAILVAVLWLDRRFLGQVLRRSLGLSSRLACAEEEALAYRWATLGVLIGVGFLWWFLARAGMSHWVAIVFLSLYFTMMLFISRVRAQLGPPTHDLTRTTPNWLLRTVMGTGAMGPHSLGVFTLLHAYLGPQNAHPAPGQLEALKMAEGGRMQRRRVALALTIVVPLAVICYFWSYVHLGCRLGVANARVAGAMTQVSGWHYEDLASALRDPAGPDVSGSMAIGFGMLFTWLLMMLKLRFSWWPVHPVAFPLGLSEVVQEFTPAIFVAWLIKALLLRYGGLRAHRAALPFFLGLIAGHMTFYSLQAVFCLIFGVTPTLW